VSADRVERIREALSALQPVRLDIRDDSAKHAGHAGARDGRGHFSVSIVSAAFDGLPPIQRHKRVYAAMGALMDTDVHALAIVAKTPAEAGV
jgi:BolA protein